MLTWLVLNAAAATLDVRAVCGPSSTCHTSIGSAIDASQPGDEVWVHAANLLEDELYITHDLTLIGQPQTGGGWPTVRFTSTTADGFLVEESSSGDAVVVEVKNLSVRPDRDQRALNVFGDATLRVVGVDVQPAAGPIDLDPIGGKGAYATLGGTLELINSDFSGFRVFDPLDPSPDGSDGGAAVVADGAERLKVDGCTFTDLVAHRGGAIEVRDTTTTVANSTFKRNTATAAAFANQAVGGGAIYVYNSSIVVEDSTFENNRAARSHGGDILLAGPEPEWQRVVRGSRVGPGVTTSGSDAGRDGGSISVFYVDLEVDGMNATNTSAAAGLLQDLGSGQLEGWGGVVAAQDHNGLVVRNLTSQSTSAVAGGAIGLTNSPTKTAELELVQLKEGGAREGGLIATLDAPFTLTGSTLELGTAELQGGCVAVVLASAEIRDSQIHDCLSGTDSEGERGGGGVWGLDTRLSLLDLTLRNNTVLEHQSKPAAGGHVLVQTDVETSELVAVKVDFDGGRADTGGGLGLINSSATLTDTLFRNNEAATVGGAIAIAQPGPTTILRPGFCNNTARFGAALATGLQGSDATGVSSVQVDNAVFRDSSSVDGAAVWANGVDLTVNHSTFFGNSGQQAPTLVSAEGSTTVTLTRNLLILSDASAAPVAASTAQISADANTWWPSAPSLYAGSNAVTATDVSSTYGTDPGYCADPWVWPTLASSVVDLSDDGSIRADLDGSAPDAGAAGGPLADPVYWADSDGDGVADPHDCDPTNPTISPITAESCDGLDNDCDGLVDEDFSDTWYPDDDGDGYGNPFTTSDCPQPGWATNGDDCDDLDDAQSPEGSESCNGEDDNCDGQVDEGVAFEGYEDIDGDGFGTGPLKRACSEEALADLDGDCNDGDPNMNPSGLETCNEIDDDCDGQVDQDASDATEHFVDLDGDGVGGSSLGLTCPGENRVSEGGDCDDTDPTIGARDGRCRAVSYRVLTGGCQTAPAPTGGGLLLLVGFLFRQRRREHDSP